MVWVFCCIFARYYQNTFGGLLQSFNEDFINESLTRMKELIAFEGRKLKREGLINAGNTKNGVLHIKI